MGGTLNLVDGSFGTYNFGGGLIAPSGASAAKAAQIAFDIGGSLADSIALTSSAAIGTSNAVVINLNPISYLNPGSYTLLTDPAGGLGGSGFKLASNVIYDTGTRPGA